MITIENTTIYKCEYCRKTYQKKNFCEAHEIKCYRNPNNFIKCSDCKFLDKLPMVHNKWILCFIHGEQESESTTDAFFCSKKQHWLYPSHKCNNPIQQDDIINDVPNEPMPKECDMYEYKFE